MEKIFLCFLDLLEVCDSDYMKKAASAAPDGNDNFEEDFALITGQNFSGSKKSISDNDSGDESDELEDFLNQDDDESESNEEEGIFTR